MNEINLPIFHTNRLLLRPMEIKDADLVVKWRNNIRIRNFSQNKTFLTVSKHKSWFLSSRNKRIDYLFCLIDTCKPIGSLSFKINTSDFDDNISANVEMGKYIGDEVGLGKGYAQEATKKWINVGRNFFNFHDILVKTNKENIVNIHINKKLGFRIFENSTKKNTEWLFMIKDNKNENK